MKEEGEEDREEMSKYIKRSCLCLMYCIFILILLIHYAMPANNLYFLMSGRILQEIQYLPHLPQEQ